MGWFVYFEVPSTKAWDRRYFSCPSEVIEYVKKQWGTRTEGRFTTRVVLEVRDLGDHYMKIELISRGGETLAKIVPESWDDWELGWKKIFKSIAEARLEPFAVEG